MGGRQRPGKHKKNHQLGPSRASDPREKQDHKSPEDGSGSRFPDFSTGNLSEPPSSVPPRPPASPDPSDPIRPKDESRNGRGPSKWLKFWVEVLTLVAVGIYTGYSIYQTVLTRHALDNSIKQTHILDRPWVTADGLTVESTESAPWGGSPNRVFEMYATVTFSNTGRSVASNGLSYFWIMSNLGDYLGKKWNEPCKFTANQRNVVSESGSNPWPVGFLLAPGEKVQITIGGSGIDPDPKTQAASGPVVTPEMAAKGSYSVIGCTLYDDQLGVTHHTQWCFEPAVKLFHDFSPKDPLVFKKCESMSFAD